MKKLLVAFLFIFGFACSPDDSVAPLRYEYVGLKNNALLGAEDEGNITATVYYGGYLENASSFTVEYTITGGSYGTNYTVVGGSGASGTVTVAPGSAGTAAIGTIVIAPVVDNVKEDNVELTLVLGAASNGISVGHPLTNKISITINDDDCDYVEADFVGNAGGREIYGPGDEYPDIGEPDYDVAFTAIGGDVLEMDNFWDSGWTVQVEIDPVAKTAVVPTQVINAFGAVWTLSGTGVVDTCNKILVLTVHLVDDGTYSYDETFDNRYQF